MASSPGRSGRVFGSRRVLPVISREYTNSSKKPTLKNANGGGAFGNGYASKSSLGSASDSAFARRQHHHTQKYRAVFPPSDPSHPVASRQAIQQFERKNRKEAEQRFFHQTHPRQIHASDSPFSTPQRKLSKKNKRPAIPPRQASLPQSSKTKPAGASSHYTAHMNTSAPPAAHQNPAASSTLGSLLRSLSSRLHQKHEEGEAKTADSSKIQLPSTSSPPIKRSHQQRPSQEKMNMPMQPFTRHHPQQLHEPQSSTRTADVTQCHSDNGGADGSNPNNPGGARNNAAPLKASTGNTPGPPAPILAAQPSTKASSSSEEPGLLSRLLRLRTSNRKSVSQTDNKKKQWRTSKTGDNNYEPIPDDPAVGQLPQTSPENRNSSASNELVDLQKQQQPPRVQSSKREPAPGAPQATALVQYSATASSAPRPTPKRQRQSQDMPNPSTAQSRLHSKPSFRERFWTKAGANDFGDDVDDDNSRQPPYQHHAPTATYVPKHAASDFSRTTGSPRHRHSYSLDDDRNISVRPLTTIMADASEDHVPQQLRHVTAATAAAEENTNAAHDGISPQQTPGKSREVARGAPTSTHAADGADTPAPQDQQRHHATSTASPADNASHSRPPQTHNRTRQSHRHSYSLVSDPFDKSATPTDPSATTVVQEQGQEPEMTVKQQRRSAPPESPAFPAAQLQHQGFGDDMQQSDYQLFMANALAEERAHRAQIWRSLSQRSREYAHGPGRQNTPHPTDASIATTAVNGVPVNRSSKRDSAYYSAGAGKRASGTTVEDDSKKLLSTAPPGDSTEATTHGQGQKMLRRQASITQRIADYIRPPRAAQPGYDDYNYRPASRTAIRRNDSLTKGAPNRRAIFTEGVVEER